MTINFHSDCQIQSIIVVANGVSVKALADIHLSGACYAVSVEIIGVGNDAVLALPFFQQPTLAIEAALDANGGIFTGDKIAVGVILEAFGLYFLGICRIGQQFV